MSCAASCTCSASACGATAAMRATAPRWTGRDVEDRNDPTPAPQPGGPMIQAPRRARAVLWTMLVVLLAAAGVSAGEETQDKPNPAPSASPSPPSPVTVEEGNPTGAVTGPCGTGHLPWEGDRGSRALLNPAQFPWTDRTPDGHLPLPGPTSPAPL